MNLYELVGHYDQADDHRTGSASEAAIEQWLCETLTSIGADIEFHEYRYDYYDAQAEVRFDQRLVAAMPLYYEAVGTIQQSQNVATGAIKIEADEKLVYKRIQALTAQAKSEGREALILSTLCANDSLHALNVTPVLKNTLPVILIPGSEANNLEQVEITVEFNASLSDKTSRNIIAHFGAKRLERSLVITTPITGWFSCAGERGTGIAIAIELARQLSQLHLVSLVLTTGHELGYLGGFKFTDTLKSGPQAVIHIGSCVGAAQSSLMAYNNLSAKEVESLNKFLSSIAVPIVGVDQPREKTNWVGEAECWAQFGCPMISIAGDNPLFHTPEDRLPAATSPEILQETSDVLLEHGRVFVITS